MKYDPNDMRTWAVEDNPATKITVRDPREMSDSELLTIVISSGYAPLRMQAGKILSNVDNSFAKLSKLSYKELMDLPGIGEVRASRILATFEIGRRIQSNITPKVQVKSSETVFNIFHPILGNLQHEEFWLLMLNRANRVIGKYKISQGGLSGTVIDTRIIMKKAIENLASTIIVCHNHPSDNRQPSDADITITEKIKRASELMEMKLLDHVIIAGKEYFSFADEGLIL